MRGTKETEHALHTGHWPRLSRYAEASRPGSLPVLVVADLFQPFDGFAIERLLNRDVRHGRCRCGAMPVFFVRRKLHNIAGMDLLNRAALALRPTTTSG